MAPGADAGELAQGVAWNRGTGRAIGMEACGGAHPWARTLQAHGYAVKLIAPQFVKPYVKSNKNDANDADAIWSPGTKNGQPRRG